MSKRGRENPCHICGHYHKYEEGETCGICGHRPLTAAEKSPPPSAFPSEILPEFLFLGGYDNASRAELLKAFGIRYILNAVPTCQNLFKNTFTYYTCADPANLEECVEFIDNVRNEGMRVMVHCMSGVARSPVIVVAYLMRRGGMGVQEAIAWVKERRDVVSITDKGMQQLLQYEQTFRPGGGGGGPEGLAVFGGAGLFGQAPPGPVAQPCTHGHAAGGGGGAAQPAGLFGGFGAAAPPPGAGGGQAWGAAPSSGGTFSFGAGAPAAGFIFGGNGAGGGGGAGGDGMVE